MSITEFVNNFQLILCSPTSIQGQAFALQHHHTRCSSSLFSVSWLMNIQLLLNNSYLQVMGFESKGLPKLALMFFISEMSSTSDSFLLTIDSRPSFPQKTYSCKCFLYPFEIQIFSELLASFTIQNLSRGPRSHLFEIKSSGNIRSLSPVSVGSGIQLQYTEQLPY